MKGRRFLGVDESGEHHHSSATEYHLEVVFPSACHHLIQFVCEAVREAHLARNISTEAAGEAARALTGPIGEDHTNSQI